MFVWPCITSTTTQTTNKVQQVFDYSFFLNQSNMFRATNSPILRSIFWLHIQLLVQCTGTASDQCHGWDGTPWSTISTVELHGVSPQPWHLSAAVFVHCTSSCIYSQKVLLRMGEFVARNMLGWFKKINKRKRSCILLIKSLFAGIR